MLALGEVHTGLLQNSSALPPDRSETALALLLGERVRRSERPMAHAISPAAVTGVDCALATRSGARTRAVGTALSHVSLTGGHVLQGSSRVQVVRSAEGRRLPWPHYLSRPGSVETIGRVAPADVAQGFVTGDQQVGTLDLAAVSGRLMDAVQRRAIPDRRPPFKMWRTRLRWVAVPSERAGPRVRFTVGEGPLRTVVIEAPAETLPHAAGLCEDLALHDWLLTSLLRIVERSRIGALPRDEVVRRLAPAMDHLLHLWMPAARIDRSLRSVWKRLERRPGFTRQWTATVDRVRDQVALSTIALHGAAAELRVRSG